MIADLDRYHGIVLRQLIVSCAGPVTIGVNDGFGRVDAYLFNRAAFQIKHSSKRLSPWQFTYPQDNFDELNSLSSRFSPVWIFLVCGQDGVVGVPLDEVKVILEPGVAGVAWLRVSRGRNSMYRVSGARGTLPRAKPRGVQPFLNSIGVFRENESKNSDDQ